MVNLINIDSNDFSMLFLPPSKIGYAVIKIFNLIIHIIALSFMIQFQKRLKNRKNNEHGNKVQCVWNKEVPFPISLDRTIDR